ncbi:hypothetical protein LINPERHAP1_LOCUS42836 [Linum perenne]
MGLLARSLSLGSSSTFSCPRPELNPLSIDSELWSMAEHRIYEILCTTQPASESEKMREDVISYIEGLIKAHYTTEVFPFGSVSLKTYLPDGDVDLTVLSHPHIEEELAMGICDILQGHEHDPKFPVKIIKCSVNDISVDISFNQMAGLAALCFLERVLYKFLDYYSLFDWDNYGVCVDGIFMLSSLPNIVVEPPEGGESQVLLTREYLNYCHETFAVPVKALDDGMHFHLKSMNIVDPLKENNNLGRSVSRGNFYRIKYALSYGAEKLRGILVGPGESIGVGLERFFVNTIDRNGRGQRPDAHDPVPAFGTGRCDASDLNGDYERCHTGLMQGQWYHNYVLPNHFYYLPSSPEDGSSSDLNDTLARFWMQRHKVLNQRRDNGFRQQEMPFGHSCPAKRCSAVSGINGLARSKGTGTYIPNAAHYGETWSCVGDNQDYSPHQTQQLQSTGTTHHGFRDRASLKRGKRSKDLPLHGFPSLPFADGAGSSRTRLEVHLRCPGYGGMSSSSDVDTYPTDSSSPPSDAASMVGGDRVDFPSLSSLESFVGMPYEEATEQEKEESHGETPDEEATEQEKEESHGETPDEEATEQEKEESHGETPDEEATEQEKEESHGESEARDEDATV